VTEQHIISDQTADCNKGYVEMFAAGFSIHVFVTPYCCQTLTGASTEQMKDDLTRYSSLVSLTY
jgi:hypothetical protein